MAGVSLLCVFKFALQENHGSRIFMGRLYARLDNCLSSRIQCESKKPKFFVVHALILLKIVVSMSFLEHVFVLLDGSVQIKVHENMVYAFIRKMSDFCC